MFTQPTGKPIDPRRDHQEWKALLEEAGICEARLHDARHTAATTLLLLGVPERAVMEVMGWSNAAMVKRYAHVTAPDGGCRTRPPSTGRRWPVLSRHRAERALRRKRGATCRPFQPSRHDRGRAPRDLTNSDHRGASADPAFA